MYIYKSIKKVNIEPYTKVTTKEVLTLSLPDANDLIMHFSPKDSFFLTTLKCTFNIVKKHFTFETFDFNLRAVEKSAGKT